MPVIKSAKKKLRQDIKRQKQNKKIKDFLKDTLKKTRKNPTPLELKKAFGVIDNAAKHHLIHKNKASRLKSGLAKLAPTQKPSKKKAQASK